MSSDLAHDRAPVGRTSVRHGWLKPALQGLRPAPGRPPAQPGLLALARAYLACVFAGAKILGAIRIGDGARVGANSVVVREVPARRTAIGIPARLVGGMAPIVSAGGTAALCVPGIPLYVPEGRYPLGRGQAINLDHHLISDPVGKAIQCLLDRIDTLEVQVHTLRGEPGPIKAAACVAGAAGERCCEGHGRG